MYYRYEYLTKNETWSGIFGLFDPFERSRLGRYVKEPVWYQKNPDIPSRCWFTEYGYQKYKSLMDQIIKQHMETYHCRPQVRILHTETLENIVMCGKVQCIEITEDLSPGNLSQSDKYTSHPVITILS